MSTRAAEAPLLSLAASSAGESESRGALDPDLIAELRDSGIFRALVPAELGGGEVNPLTMREGIELIASADGAAGWCAAIGATAGLAAAYLPTELAAGLFGRDTIAAGVFAPRGRLEEGAEGTRVLTGRWPLGSGVSHSTIVGLGCVDPQRGPLYALVPRADVEVLETWDSLGLRATASHDVAVTALSVPEERIVDLIAGVPSAEGPLYRFPLFGLLAIAVSAVCTGIAAGALADLASLATERRPAGSSRNLAERATTQEAVASATATVRAATAGVDAAIEAAWSAAEAGGPLSLEQRAGLRVAATHAAQSAVGVVDVAHRLGGAGSLYRGSGLERRLRDVHTAAQHMVVAPATLELAGRVLLGVETDTAQL